MEPIEPEEDEHENRRRRIEELKEQIQRICGIPDCIYISPDCPDRIAQSFLERVLGFENREQNRGRP